MNPEVRAVYREIQGRVKEFWRLIRKPVGYLAAGGSSLILACATQPTPEQVQKPQEPQLPKETVTLQVTNTLEPKQELTATATKEPEPTPEPARFLGGILVHAVYTGKILEEDGGQKHEVGKMLATRLHDQRIHIESTRDRNKPCLDGAARVVNLNTAEDPSQFKTSPGVTAKADRKPDGSFSIKDRTTQLELTHPDPKSVKGTLKIANPANNQPLCKEATFELTFQVLGTEPLIKEVAQMNLDGRRRPTFDLDYALQSLEAISGPLPNISTQTNYPSEAK